MVLRQKSPATGSFNKNASRLAGFYRRGNFGL